MSKASVSPTARLLQNSRLFSMPKPLPVPSQTILSRQTGKILDSHTATSPYPTHQAIDTPYSSRVVGEWGLKRHLPLRTTTKNDMPIRITAQDTNDHVTDFASNGDLTMSLAKFRELSIPLLRREIPAQAGKANNNVSVYEDMQDNTDRSQPGKRWKHNGPYLASMEAYEVEEYLAKLKGKRKEWLAFLQEKLAEKKFGDAMEKALKKDQRFGPLDLQEAQLQASLIKDAADKRVQALKSQRALQPITNPEAQDAEFAAHLTAIAAEAAEEAQPFEEQVEYSRELQRIRASMRSKLASAEQARQDAQRRLDHVRRLPEATIEKLEAATTDLEQAKQDELETFDTACADAAASLLELEPELDVPSNATQTVITRYLDDLEQKVALRDEERLQKLGQWEQQLRLQLHPTAEEVAAHELELRREHRSSRKLKDTELSQLLADFLDLPGFELSKHESEGKKIRNSRTAALRNQIEEEQSHYMVQGGPPSTHPGAGLGYLRTKAYMPNHPIHGPQYEQKALFARVVRPRGMLPSHDLHAKIGIAGFIANDPSDARYARHAKIFAADPYGTDAMVSHLDARLEGGNKAWMTAQSATIREDGKVNLKLKRSDSEAIAVAKGDVSHLLKQKSGVHDIVLGKLSHTAGSPLRYTANYGSNLSSMAPLRR